MAMKKMMRRGNMDMNMEGEEEDDLFSCLPEGCISNILSFTSPRDTCRLSAVSRLFHSASKCEHIWDRFVRSGCSGFLPLEEKLQKVSSGSKKDLFFLLCDPIIISDGKLSLSLDKMTGKRCYMLSAKELLIIAGKVGRIWQQISLSKSRFEKVFSVLHISWIEIHAKIDACMLSPKTTYRAYFVFSLDREGRFDVQYAEITVKLGSHTAHSFYLYKPLHSLRCWLWNMRHEWAPQYKSDGWMEIEIGEFFIDEKVEGEVQMTLMMAAQNFIDGIFVVEGIDIRPVFK